MQYSIRGKRIRKLLLPKEFDKDIIQIGVPVKGNEDHKVGLKREGNIVVEMYAESRWGSKFYDSLSKDLVSAMPDQKSFSPKILDI